MSERIYVIEIYRNYWPGEWSLSGYPPTRDRNYAESFAAEKNALQGEVAFRVREYAPTASGEQK